MKFSCLRRIPTAEVKARSALAYWPRRDPALAGRLAYTPAPPTASVVGVRAYRDGICWSGYLDLDEWLACAAPGVAALAGTEQARHAYARSLFEASGQPLQMPLPELDYAVLRLDDSGGHAPFTRRRCLLTLHTPQGRVWLCAFPELDMPLLTPLSAAAAAVPVQAAWRLGHSSASRRLVGALRRGDVLLITTEIFELTSAGIAIGRFSINQDGEISVQAASMKEPGEPVGQDADQARPASFAPGVAASVADVPLRLDFILQRRTLTVAELDALYQGQVLQLDPQAEKRVEIMVSGMRLAIGELVELNGRLGVELHEVGGARAPAEAQHAQ